MISVPYIVNLAKSRGSLEGIRKKSNYLEGCTANLWLEVLKLDNKLHFLVDSDSLVVRGTSLIITSRFLGLTKKDVLEKDIDFSDLGNLLSISRRNGISLLVTEIKKKTRSIYES